MPIADDESVADAVLMLCTCEKLAVADFSHRITFPEFPVSAMADGICPAQMVCIGVAIPPVPTALTAKALDLPVPVEPLNVGDEDPTEIL